MANCLSKATSYQESFDIILDVKQQDQIIESSQQKLPEQDKKITSVEVDSLCAQNFKDQKQNFLFRITIGKRSIKHQSQACNKKLISQEVLKCQPISQPQGKLTMVQDLRKVENASKYPYSAIGCLIAFFSKQTPNFNPQNSRNRVQVKKNFGTGFIIYKNYIMTCAHVVYNRQTQEAATYGKFISGLNGTDGTQYDIKKEGIHFPSQYMKADSESAYLFDYAIVEIEPKIISQQLSKTYGSFGINTLVKTDSQGQLYGYVNNETLVQRKYKGLGWQPHMDRNIYQQQKWLFGMKGAVAQYKSGNQFITYQIQTDPGQSGSPIYRKVGVDNYQVIGIHQRFIKDNNREFNCGIKISQCKQLINKIIRIQNKKISINGKQFAENIVKDIVSYCKRYYHTQLTILDLSKNSISSQQLKNIRLHGTELLGLRTLNLSQNQITDQGIIFLMMNSTPFFRLQRLILSNNKIGEKGVAQLINKHDQFPGLLELYLNRNQITPKAIRKLCSKHKDKIKAMPFLDKLQIGDNYKFDPSKDNDLKYILDAFPNLTQIGCRKNFTNDQGFVDFAQGEKLKNLSLISFGNNFITGKGLKSFTKQCKIFKSLTRLYLQYNAIDAQHISCLSKLGKFPALIDLQIFFNKLQAKGVQNLMKIENSFPCLQRINLAGNSIKSQGCEKISIGSWAMPRLKCLILDFNSIEDQGVNKLIKIKGIFPLLNQLSLRSNGLTAQSVNQLILNGYFPELTKLNLSNNKIGDEGFKYFCKPQKLLSNAFEKLQTLLLNCTDITSIGFKLIVAHEKAFSKLKTLGLNQNKIDMQSVKQLLQSRLSIISQQGSLSNIFLQKSNLSHENFDEIRVRYRHLKLKAQQDLSRKELL